MSFWERVEEMLDEKGLTKKLLAAAVGIDPSTISKGKENNSFPSADTAVKIAQYLCTSVEFLVTGEYSQKKEIDELYKAAPLIQKLNKIPENTRSSIELMISDLSEKISG